MRSGSQTIDQNEAPSDLISQLRSQSTIYRRHEARLARSNALKDDPRPAAVRVLSGLPGFRMVFEPYQPPCKGISPVESPKFAFSQETVYSINESGGNVKDEDQVPELQRVVVAAGMGGAASELVFGGKSKSSIHRSTLPAYYSKGASPFSAVQSADGMLALSSGSTAGKSRFFFMPMRRGVTMSHVASGAAFASLLFGTKYFVDTKLDDTKASPLVSSSCAGAAIASVLAPLQAVRSYMMLQKSVGQMKSRSLAQGTLSLVRSTGVSSLYAGAHTVYAREIIGATLYFTAYDYLKGRLFKENNSSQVPASNLVVATSGAVAGSLYRSVVLAFEVSTMHGASLSRGLLPVVLRAAPANALLFLGYETALRYMPATTK